MGSTHAYLAASQAAIGAPPQPTPAASYKQLQVNLHRED
jgi:hypothetical protein